jgi:hypothetical protein
MVKTPKKSILVLKTNKLSFETLELKTLMALSTRSFEMLRIFSFSMWLFRLIAEVASEYYFKALKPVVDKQLIARSRRRILGKAMGYYESV